jgi:hypothetical protein
MNTRIFFQEYSIVYSDKFFNARNRFFERFEFFRKAMLALTLRPAGEGGMRQKEK